MKKKFVIINCLLSVVVLFSILFQSVHSFEHLVKQLSEKKCHHKPILAFDITHEHKHFDDCFVCEFALGFYVDYDLKKISFSKNSPIYKNDSFHYEGSNYYFTGISYSLRGPPFV